MTKLKLPEEQKQQIEKYFGLCSRLHISQIFRIQRTGTYYAMHFFADYIQDDKEVAAKVKDKLYGVRVEIEIPYKNVPLDEYRIYIRIIKEHRKWLGTFDEDDIEKYESSCSFLHYVLVHKEDLLFIREKLLAYYFERKEEYMGTVIKEMDEAIEYEAEVPVLKKYNVTITYKVDVKAFDKKGARTEALKKMSDVLDWDKFETVVEEVIPKLRRVTFLDETTEKMLWTKKIGREGKSLTVLENRHPIGQFTEYKNKMYQVVKYEVRGDTLYIIVTKTDEEKEKKEELGKGENEGYVIKEIDKDFVTVKVPLVVGRWVMVIDPKEIEKYNKLKAKDFSANCVCGKFHKFEWMEFMLSDGILCWRCPTCKIGNIIPDNAWKELDDE